MWLGCTIGVILRYFLYLAGAPAYLEERLEIVSPMTSHVALKEGLFLLSGGISPYAGETCRHPPLVLLLLAPLRHAPALAHFSVVVLADLATALLLRLIAVQCAAAKVRAGIAWREASVRPVKDIDTATTAGPALEDVVSPAFIGLSYLLNPFVIASCLATSLQNFHHLAICTAICCAGAGWVGATAGALALVIYVCPFTPLVLLLPCSYLSFSQREDASSVKVAKKVYVRSKDSSLVEPRLLLRLGVFTAAVLLLFACLLGASAAALDGDLHFLQASFLSVLTLRDLTPNVGIFWYVFIEVFDRYRSLFLWAFHGHLLFYSVPLHTRLGRHRPVGPWLHCIAAVGIVTLFKPYPTASDFGLMLSTLLIQVELIREAEKQFAFLLSGLLFGLCMFPTMSAVWLARNAGNANFVYNMTLVINVFGCLLLTEWLRAGLKLRRREHMGAFCRQVVLDALEQALSTSGNKDAASPDGAAEPTQVPEAQATGSAVVDGSGPRCRP